jgi:chromosome segregation and condensation protein ScpB
MTDEIMQAAVLAYEFASDEPVSERALRAAVSRALRMQREEIADAVDEEAARLRGVPFRGGKVGFEHIQGMEAAAQFIRDHGRES